MVLVRVASRKHSNNSALSSARRLRIRNPTHEESSSSVSSAHVVACNNDLLSEILLRLPIKTLLKFKFKSADNYGQILSYSSEIGAWRVSGAPFVASLVVNFVDGAYWNGATHWLDELGEHSLCFDLNEELVQEMPMPPRPED